MIEDDLPLAHKTAPALAALAREDLDNYSVADLEDRISLLETEIVRARAAMESKKNRRSAADALFSFKGP